MPAADYERAMLRVRAHIASKPSHGSAELLREVARIEKDCEVPEAEEGYDDRPRRRAVRAHEGDMSPSADEPAHAVA